MEGFKVFSSFIVLILISNVVLGTKDGIKEPPNKAFGAAAVMPISPEGVGTHRTCNPPPKDAQTPPAGNAIVVPDNCPPGQKLIAGHCREILDMEADAKQ